MHRLLRAAARLDRAAWRDLALAQWLLLLAQLRLRTRAAGSLVGGGARTESPSAGRPLDRATVQRAAWAVDRVVAFGPLRARCLARAITLRELLDRRGIDEAVVRVGVRKVDGRFDAHAWVELRGHVIGEHAEHVRQFTVFSGLTLVDDR
jgi:Transglutaminase-like superfamily